MLKIVSLALGLALVVVALLTDSAGIERTLLGEADGRLEWGPTLFRALLAWHGLLLILIGWRVGRRTPTNSALASSAPETPSAAPGTSRGALALLLAMAALATLVRCIGLDSCLWIDEVFTLLDFGRLPLGELVTRFPSQNQHLLYSLLMFGPLRVLGESPVALRLPALVLGVATLWPLFRLGQKLCGEREALFACALLTLSYHHVWFSQNARGYSGLLFFSTLSTWYWLEALDQPRRGSWWIGYVASIVLGLTMHMTMIFVVASHGLVGLTRLALPGARAERDPRWRSVAALRALTAFTLGGTLTLQLYALALPEFLREALHEVSLETEWTNPLWAVQETLRGLQIGWAGTGAVGVGLGLALLGWLAIARKNLDAAVLMVLPALLGGASMLASGHNIWPRFFLFCMGFGLLLVVAGATAAPELLRRLLGFPNEHFARALGNLLVLGMVAVFALGLPRVWSHPKQDFTGARDYVEQSAEPGATLVSVGLAAKVFGPYFAPDWTSTEEFEEFQAARSGQEPIWLVYTQPIYMKDYEPRTWAAIEADFETLEVFPGTLGGGEVFVAREIVRERR